jgi:hypothetical protein
LGVIGKTLPDIFQRNIMPSSIFLGKGNNGGGVEEVRFFARGDVGGEAKHSIVKAQASLGIRTLHCELKIATDMQFVQSRIPDPPKIGVGIDAAF